MRIQFVLILLFSFGTYIESNAVSCRNGFVKFQAPEPARKLRFTNTAVTKDENFQFGVQFSPAFQIVEVSADSADDVLSPLLSANLGWKVVEPATI